MPVKLNVLKTKGWKTVTPEKRGDIIVIEFIDVKTNKLLFTYAPKWVDVSKIIDCLEMMFNNELNKLYVKNQGLQTFNDKFEVKEWVKKMEKKQQKSL